MQFKNFVKGFFFISITFLFVIALFNYSIDPHWTFSHSHKFNTLQKSSNERETKEQLYIF